MPEFLKLCKEVEGLNPIERGILLKEKSIAVFKGLNNLNTNSTHSIEILALFVIGSLASEGSISEKNYLYIYPSLLKAFGEKCDLAEMKHRLAFAKDLRKEIKNCTQQMIEIVSMCDEELKKDVILLCLLVTSVDGKISLKERRYIRQLNRL